MTDKHQPLASFELHIISDTGYESTAEGRCTVGQYSLAMGALCGDLENELALIKRERAVVLRLLKVIDEQGHTSHVINEVVIEAIELMEGNDACLRTLKRT